MSTDPELRTRLAEAILGDRPDGSLEDPAAQLALVAQVRDAEVEVRELLQQSVNSARAAGQSWSALGATLGMSRQAVQQRFGRDTEAAASLEGDAADMGAPEERWLGPVTAFDEMAELAIAGRLGWRTVGAKMFFHRVQRTPTQWEHRRTVWSGPVRRLEKDGWQVGVLAFPWVYLVRDTGLPAAEE